ncbi:endopeptidase La, partial [Candidatus Poribacteria bacterium]|nr:endopeptidase La [Candidatus Poribacteria bacterium]
EPQEEIDLDELAEEAEDEGMPLPEMMFGQENPDDEPMEEVDLPEELPIIAMRGGTVVFPGMPPTPPFMPPYLAFQGGRAMSAVEAAMRDEPRIVGLIQLKDDPTDKAFTLDDIHPIGTLIYIARFRKGDEGAFLLVQGRARIRILEFTQQDPYITARVESLTDLVLEDVEMEALKRSVRSQFGEMAKLSGNHQEEIAELADHIEHPGHLADFVATLTEFKSEQKQDLLGTLNVTERLRKLGQMLAREVNVLAVGAEIQSQAQEELSKDQREYVLRQQLKQIRKELGEEEDQSAEIDELRERLAEASLPEEAHKATTRELDRLARMPTAAAEYTVSRTYIETILELPWHEATEDNHDIKAASDVLDEDHFGLNKVKERIVEYLAVRKLKANMRGPILCFVGPPGVGKTSLGRSIARALGRKFIRMSLGGLRDEAEIRGHRRTYIGSLPGRIIQNLRTANSNNPVFMLDEVDKLGSDFRGDPASALLEVLDPEQNHTFTDHYLDIPFDLSRVMFIATANMMDSIPAPLLDRMEVITIAGYTPEEKIAIARQYLVPKQTEEHGLTAEQADIDDGALARVVKEYTREAGVRNLEREVGSVVRKIALKVAQEDAELVKVTSDDIPEHLGPPKIIEELAERVDEPGIVTGLAWTPSGGDILFIEATKMPGKGVMNITGSLSDVMKESAQAALSYVRSNAGSLGVDSEMFEKNDFHIHVPAGAVPKDGPSAGVAMTTAIASLVMGRKLKSYLAITGEVTLRGKVLPVGGIKEKSLAAKRAGVKTVILPAQNEKDLAELTDAEREGLTFILAASVSDAMDAALEA